MRHLSGPSSLPWICASAFNEVLDAGEQFGGNPRPERLMDGFREAVQICGFSDLGFSGLPYTWAIDRMPLIISKFGLIGGWQMEASSSYSQTQRYGTFRPLNPIIAVFCWSVTRKEQHAGEVERTSVTRICGGGMNHILIWSVRLGVLKFPVILANSMTGYHKLKSLLRNGNTMCSDQSGKSKN